MQSEPMESTSLKSQKGTLVVAVPTEAKVLVNGVATKTMGDVRRYVSHGLKPGRSYRYEVKATVPRNGEMVEETKVVTLRAGEVSRVSFAMTEESVQTRLTLHVPTDAKVYLSGRETKAQGAVRSFSSSRIAEGKKWADYEVRVTVERDGRLVTKEKRITLSGGDQSELRFDFDQTELAAAN